MISSLRVSVTAVFLATLLLVGVGVQSASAQAENQISAAIQAQITTIIENAVTTGDTDALEDAITALTEAIPGLAVAIANFASSKVPSTLSNDVAGNLVASITTGVMTGAPTSSSAIITAMKGNFPTHDAKITTESQNTLSALAVAGIDTAAGGRPPGGPPGGFTTAAGGPPGGGGFLPARARGGVNRSGERNPRPVPNFAGIPELNPANSASPI